MHIPVKNIYIARDEKYAAFAIAHELSFANKNPINISLKVITNMDNKN